jgi:hypothetical protein
MLKKGKEKEGKIKRFYLFFVWCQKALLQDVDSVRCFLLPKTMILGRRVSEDKHLLKSYDKAYQCRARLRRPLLTP